MKYTCGFMRAFQWKYTETSTYKDAGQEFKSISVPVFLHKVAELQITLWPKWRLKIFINEEKLWFLMQFVLSFHFEQIPPTSTYQKFHSHHFICKENHRIAMWLKLHFSLQLLLQRYYRENAYHVCSSSSVVENPWLR